MLCVVCYVMCHVASTKTGNKCYEIRLLSTQHRVKDSLRFNRESLSLRLPATAAASSLRKSSSLKKESSERSRVVINRKNGIDYFCSGLHLLINDDKDKCCCFEADRETS